MHHQSFTILLSVYIRKHLMIINQSRKVSVLQTFSEVLIENLLAEILPVTESLSR